MIYGILAQTSLGKLMDPIIIKALMESFPQVHFNINIMGCLSWEGWPPLDDVRKVILEANKSPLYPVGEVNAEIGDRKVIQLLPTKGEL